jgi:hypothetical protein
MGLLSAASVYNIDATVGERLGSYTCSVELATCLIKAMFRAPTDDAMGRLMTTVGSDDASQQRNLG